MWTLFQYLYRDAGNFKAFGSLALEGEFTADEQHRLRALFPADGVFIAEQMDVPTLYDELYRWSNGPSSSDHCWHEFVKVTVADGEVPIDLCRWGSAKEFLERLSAVTSWNEELSPHFRLKA